MTVYYFQGEQILAPISIRSNHPVFSADTISLKRQQVQSASQRWEMEFNVAVNDPVSFFTDTIIANQGSNTGRITMTMPQIYRGQRHQTENEHTATGTINTGAASVGATSVSLNGTSADGGRVIRRGTFIKFSNHDKIYLIINSTDLTLNSAGDGTINIYPSLRTALLTSDTLRYRNNGTSSTTGDVQVTCWRDTTNINGITFSDGLLADPGVVRLVETV